jgi:hypothetical protein
VDSSRKLRKELGYEIAKLHGLQQSVDLTRDEASAQALALKVREQAGVCLGLLDHYQSSVPGRMWSDAERRCKPLREELKRTEWLFRTNSGEWQRRTVRPSYAVDTGDWTFDDYFVGLDGRDSNTDEDGSGADVASHAASSHSDVEADDRQFDGHMTLGDDENDESEADVALFMASSRSDAEAEDRQLFDSIMALVDDDNDESEADVASHVPSARSETETDDQQYFDDLMALVDDVSQERVMAKGSLRFTLPTDGGVPEQNMLVLVPSETGLVYEHQYGGLSPRHAEVEGFLVPAWAHPKARDALDQLFSVDLGGNGVRDDDRSEVVSRVGDAVARILYCGTDDRMAPLRIDEERVDEMDEAWVPVLTPDGPAYLTWTNSDRAQTAPARRTWEWHSFV